MGRAGVCFFDALVYFIWLDSWHASGTEIILWGGRTRKIILWTGIIILTGELFVFKYLTFCVHQVASLFGMTSNFEIALPIGISFFLFQLLSYLFDVYYGTVPPEKDISKVALYVSLFPQLIAGPIVRYGTISKEICNRDSSLDDVGRGIERFIYGLGKKLLLADYLSIVADSIFGMPQRTVAVAWLGSICYTLQIYYDFSGYSDMAIGLGRMFGFHFPENFNYPYVSTSVTEFWQRWHMSLSRWFRDYVYIPLGGNRYGRWKQLRNLLIVWLMTGIWHGANWTFLLWGIVYYTILCLEKIIRRPRASWVGHIYTLLVVNVAWVIFRSDDIVEAVRYLGNMIGLGTVGIMDVNFISLFTGIVGVLIIGVILATPICPWGKRLLTSLGTRVEVCLRQAVSVGILVLSVLHVVGGSYSPFIYFNF